VNIGLSVLEKPECRPPIRTATAGFAQQLRTADDHKRRIKRPGGKDR
jgi:hypothetical protein